MKKEKRTIIFEIVFIFMLLAFTVVSFNAFIRDNRKRVMDQNNDFIKATTVQNVERINELIEMSRRNLDMMAHFYPSLMVSPNVNTDILNDMVSRSYFDYVEFISPDGTDLTAKGQTADLSDREYFIDGMKGNSGKCVINNSRITNETLLIFYSPFYYKGEIIGVLSGILKDSTVHQALSPNYSDVKGSSYLVEPDGDVILSDKENSKLDNVLDYLLDNEKMKPDDLEKLKTAMRDGTSTYFNYTGDNGAGSAYVTPLKDGEWILIQTLPSSLITQMVEGANSAGGRLEIKLIIVFLLYVIYLLWKNRGIRRQLVSKNREMSEIVSAITQLFARFSLVNYENDTYEYLKGKKNDIPKKGNYTDLVNYLDSKYIDDDGNPEKTSTRISQGYVQEHLTEDVPYLQYEYQIEMDGRRWENVSVICLKRKDGIPVKVLYAIQDVSQLKETERQIRFALKDASAAAEAASNAKSDFLARMSHDIRTPMNAIIGMTAVAEMHIDDKEYVKNCLGKITVSSRHLLSLINDVLDMSKIESGKVSLSKEPFSIVDIVDSVITIVRPQTKSRNQDLKVHIDDVEHENVIGDALRIRQVLVNILGNAVKFTPEGGRIVFSIKECKSKVASRVCYEFVCEDNGVGMDEDFVKKIFDPFTRSDSSVSHKIEGTGLGMAITRNIVRMMDGDISVESTPGVGSKFTVSIHLKKAGSETENVRELANMRVLVADGDREACIGACNMLQSIGMRPEWVLSGEETVKSVAVAHERNEDFDVVILYRKMPDRDGAETAREIRRIVGDGAPVIIMSAYDLSDIEIQAQETGIQAFIEKPLFYSRLVYVLKSIFANKGNSESDKRPEPNQARYRDKRVLLVEDNELNSEIAQELLSYIGVNVEHAANGSVAVDMVAQAPPYYYDLIFMDIQMPVMDGYEAARRIRGFGSEYAAKIPIIAMTANAFMDDIRKSHEAGMNDHVAKPVEVGKLISVLDQWL